MLSSARSRFLLLASLAIVVLAFAGSAAAASERSPAAAAPNDALSRALASGQITSAQYSLQRALAILAPRLANPRSRARPRTPTRARRRWRSAISRPELVHSREATAASR